MTKLLASSPQPNRLYRFLKGDELLSVAGRAYGLKAGSKRLQQTQMMNRHPFNWRLHTASQSNFNRNFFPEGIISLKPSFSCRDSDFNDPLQFPPAGSCFPIGFIPPDGDIWHRPPTEVVQTNEKICWAAAIFSLSQVTSGMKQFESVDQVIETFQKLKVNIPTESGTVEREFVTPAGGLLRLPKENTGFKTPSAFVPVRAGRITTETIATELGLAFVEQDSKLELDDVIDVLKQSTGPVIVFKHASGKIGHASVIFGASKVDQFIGEMDPFPIISRATGPAFGAGGTRWLPTFKAFREHKLDKPWDEFVFFFKKKT